MLLSSISRSFCQDFDCKVNNMLLVDFLLCGIVMNAFILSGWDCLTHERLISRIKDNFVVILYSTAARCSSWQWPTDPTRDLHRTLLSGWVECCVWLVCLPPGPHVLAACFQGYYKGLKPYVRFKAISHYVQVPGHPFIKAVSPLLSTANTLILFWSQYSC